jgi:hypothetical protein
MIAREITFAQLSWVRVFVLTRMTVAFVAAWLAIEQAGLHSAEKHGLTMMLLGAVAFGIGICSFLSMMELGNKTLYLSNGRAKMAIKEVEETVENNCYEKSVAFYRKIGPFWYRVNKPAAIYATKKSLSIYSYTPDEWWGLLSGAVV